MCTLRLFVLTRIHYSDDEKLYRCEAELTAEAEHDPLKRFGAVLIDEKVIDQDGLQKIKDEVDALMNDATDQALASPQPDPDTVKLHVYSPDVDPTAKEFDTEDRRRTLRQRRHNGGSD